MGESHALKDDVLTALYLGDSLTDSSTSPGDRFMQCHTEHGRNTALLKYQWIVGVYKEVFYKEVFYKEFLRVQRVEDGSELSLMRTRIFSVRTLGGKYK